MSKQSFGEIYTRLPVGEMLLTLVLDDVFSEITGAEAAWKPGLGSRVRISSSRDR